jgi:UDP-glucuronate 4-epimerase
MAVLVTGAAGFIGAAVSEALLRRGDRVVGIDDLNDYYSPTLKRARIARLEALGGDFSFVRVDFADPAALETALEGENFDRIVHLGAQPGVRYSLENPHAYARSNLVGHLDLLEVARRRGGVPMVYASSSSVYGGNEKVPFSVHDNVDHPFSLYAATKKADELMSESYAHLYRIPLTGLRFFTVYGPWGRPDMMPWIFTSRILSGDPIPVFNEGRMQRDFTYIDDIVSGVVACIDAPPTDDGEIKPGGSAAPHSIYNIGNNRSEPLMKAEIEMLPMQPGDVPRTFADIDAIVRDHGYRPTTSVEDGFPRFVRWFRDYHGLA